MIYKVWIQIEEINESKDHYLNISEPYEAGKFDTEAEAVKFVENELMTTQIPDSAADLLEACKVLTSYTMDLLYRLNDQVSLDDVEEIQQVKAAIAKYRPAEMPCTKLKGGAIMETIETLQELTELFSEAMLGEFADNENAPGNRLIMEHLRQKHYTNDQIATLRSVVYMDTQRSGW